MYAKYVDLALVMWLAALALLTVVFNLNIFAVNLVFMLLLILVLPGYALAALLFPRSNLGWIERTVYTIGLSLALAILSGLLINLTPWGLQKNTWVVFLSDFTLIAGFVAWFRRSRQADAVFKWPFLKLKRRDTLFFGFAFAVILWAAIIARLGAFEQNSPSFTQLWLLPANKAVQVGFSNYEGEEVIYHLKLEINNQVVKDWPSIALQEGQKWEISVQLPDGVPADAQVTASIYRSDAWWKLYRQTSLQLDPAIK